MTQWMISGFACLRQLWCFFWVATGFGCAVVHEVHGVLVSDGTDRQGTCGSLFGRLLRWTVFQIPLPPSKVPHLSRASSSNHRLPARNRVPCAPVRCHHVVRSRGLRACAFPCQFRAHGVGSGATDAERLRRREAAQESLKGDWSVRFHVVLALRLLTAAVV